MKRLLLITDAWKPQVNGPVRVIEALLPLLEQRGHDVRIVHPGEFMTVPLPFYPDISLALFAKRRIRNVIAQYQPHAIHLMTEGPLGWAARSVCCAQNLPFTTWYHSRFDLYVNIWLRGLLGPVHAALRRFHARAARTFVSNEGLQRDLTARGFTHLVIVPLGVDATLFARNIDLPLPALPKPVFVYFGRLDPEKSPEEFMRLKLPGTKLVIGDGTERSRLEKKYGSEIHFVGYKTGTELVNVLSLADVMVFPSQTETFGLVVLEALACGIPVAAHNTPGPRDIITNGVDGVLSDDLREAALKCLTLDREKCREKALRYSWDASADTFESLLAPIQ